MVCLRVSCPVSCPLYPKAIFSTVTWGPLFPTRIPPSSPPPALPGPTALDCPTPPRPVHSARGQTAAKPGKYQGPGILMCQGTGIPTYGGGGTQGYRHTGTPGYRDTPHRGHLGSGLRQGQGSLPWGRADAGEREGCSSSRSQPRRGPGAGPGTDGRVRARVLVWGTGCREGVRDPSTVSRCSRSFGSGSGCCSAPAAPAPEGSGSSAPPRRVPPVRGCRAPRRCRGGGKRLGKPGKVGAAGQETAGTG